MRTFSMTAFGIVVLWCCWVTPTETQEGSLAGVWVLNEDLSENPSASARRDPPGDRQARRGGGGGGFGGPGAGGSRGGFGGGFGAGRGGGRQESRPDPSETVATREALQSAMADLMSAPRRMTMVVTDDEVLLTYDDGRVVRLIPDDREHAGIAGNAMEVKRTTRWSEGQLVTRVVLQSRVPFELGQTYDVELDGQRLVVTSRFDGDRVSDEDREFRRVYDRESQ